MALTTEYQRIGEKFIANAPGGQLYARIYAKYNSYNSGAGTVNVTTLFQLYLTRGTAWANGNSISLDNNYWSGNISISGGEGNVQNLITSTFDVSTNADGSSKGYSSNASYTIYGVSGSLTAGFDTPQIPRYASITSYSASPIDEHTIKVNWDANASIDWVQYSLNDGAWTNASGKSFNITGLNEGTQYNVKIRVRRADSGMWTTSGSLYPKTYSYPYIREVKVTNLIIGSEQELVIENPLNRTFTIKMNKDSADGELLYQYETNGISYKFTPNNNTLYSSIPNNSEGDCVYSIVYSGVTKSTTKYKYLINANESKPIFTNFTYSTNLQSLTGNNNTIVSGKTTTTIIIKTSDKAIGNNGASISRYSVQIDNLESQEPKLINYSNDSNVSASINACTSDIIRVTAIDSRGLETTVTKTIANFKNYFVPTFVSYNVEREDGVEEDVYLDTELNFWNHSFGEKTNKINKFEFRAKETSSMEYSNWIQLNAGAFIITNEKAVLKDYHLFLDGISQGFRIGVSYDIQLRVTDGVDNYDLSSTESGSFRLIDGKIAFSILKDENGEYHIGINGMPDLDHTLKVYGTIVNNNS